MPTSNFDKYAVYYDLLYREKNYASEADYVAEVIRARVPHARTILELGSGTGRHGRLLAAMGFCVHGVERSPEMVARATATVNSENGGSFTCELGDIRTVKLDRRFDAIVALFHVMSYLTSNEGLQAAFRVASDHLEARGLFLFDVWHGPAVLSERPTSRTKEVSDEKYHVIRIARPELDTNDSTVKVVYEMSCENRTSGEVTQVREEHLMRYLFPTEIDLLAANCGLRRVITEEFLTGNLASDLTWGVMHGLQR